MVLVRLLIKWQSIIIFDQLHYLCVVFRGYKCNYVYFLYFNALLDILLFTVMSYFNELLKSMTTSQIFLLLLCLLFQPKLFFQCVNAVPVRVIVDVQDKSPHRSSSEEGVRYSPVFPQRHQNGMKTIPRSKQKRRPQTYEERNESNRERLRKMRKERPEYARNLFKKAYDKRKNDPEKRARDKAYLKEYQLKNKARLSAAHKEYMRKRRSEQKAAQNHKQENVTTAVKKRKRIDSSDQEIVKYQKDGAVDNVKKHSHPPIIARLKLPAKTIEEFYGPQPPKS